MLLVPYIATRFGPGVQFKVAGLLALAWLAMWWRVGSDQPPDGGGSASGSANGLASPPRLAEEGSIDMEAVPLFNKKEDPMPLLQEDGAGGGGGGGVAGGRGGRADSSGIPWGVLMRSSAVWAIVTNNFAFHYATYVLMSWLPTYFQSHVGVALSDMSSRFKVRLCCETEVVVRTNSVPTLGAVRHVHVGPSRRLECRTVCLCRSDPGGLNPDVAVDSPASVLRILASEGSGPAAQCEAPSPSLVCLSHRALRKACGSHQIPIPSTAVALIHSLLHAANRQVMPYVMMFLASNMGGSLGSWVQSRGKSIIFSRKFVNTLGFSLACISLLLMPRAAHWRDAVLYTTMALSALGLCRGGWAVNHMDIAPRHAGVVMAIANGAGTLAGGVVGVSLTGRILDEMGGAQEAVAWTVALGVVAFICLTALVVFLCLARGDTLFH